MHLLKAFLNEKKTRCSAFRIISAVFQVSNYLDFYGNSHLLEDKIDQRRCKSFLGMEFQYCQYCGMLSKTSKLFFRSFIKCNGNNTSCSNSVYSTKHVTETERKLLQHRNMGCTT